MRTQSKSLKIGKGDKAKSFPFKYEEPENPAELQAAFDANLAAGLLSDKLTVTKIFNYGLDLKIRAKVKEANTETGMLTKQRQRTTAWVMTPGSGGGDFLADLTALLVAGDTKAVNEYLDDLYATEEEAIVSWKPQG